MIFSVIVTVYNLGSFLEECLNSIECASNGYLVEVVVVNDGSNDTDTINVLDASRKKYPHFRFIDKLNGGPASARNFGILNSTGDYIIPFDADNIMRLYFFKNLMNAILDTDSQFDVYYYKAQFFGEKREVWPVKSFDQVEMALSNQIDACACINKSVFQRYGLFDENRDIVGFEDWEYWIRLMSSSAKFYFINDVLYDYRCRESSTLSLAWSNRNLAVDYIFSKKENSLFFAVRKLAMENINFKKPLSLNQLFRLFFKKIKSAF